MIDLRKYSCKVSSFFVASCFFIGSATAASLNIKELVEETVKEARPSTTAPVVHKATRGKGIVTLNVENSKKLLEALFPLKIEITDLANDIKVNVIPGSYEYRAGEYKVRVYRENPDTLLPYEQYQTINDTINVTTSGTIDRNYHSPIRRGGITSAYFIGASLLYGYMPDSYNVSNPQKEHLDSLSVANNLADSAQLGDTNFGAQGQLGYALTAAYMFPARFMIEADYYGTSDSNLSLQGASLGVGWYIRSANFTNSFSIGGGIEKASWASATYTSSFGSNEVNSSIENSLFYVKWTGLHKGTGVSYSVKYDVSNTVVTANFGWSFYREKSVADIPASIQYSQ